MPVFAAIPAALAAVGTAAGATAAAATTVGGFIVGGTALATGLGIAGAVSSASQASSAKKAEEAAQNQANNTTNTTVGDPTLAQTNNLGRAALISTSSSGVQGLDPTGRRSLLGND
jgi:hypothetical protein